MLSLLPPTAAQLLLSSTAQRDYSSFSASMQSYYRAEICKLVAVYLLNQSSIAIDKSAVGLYRDGGLAAINNANSPKLNRMRKNIIALFPQEVFSITIETSLIQTSFLDVIFSLATEKYCPLGKANHTPINHINALSNHLPAIIK